jgi:hypothetical protein
MLVPDRALPFFSFILYGVRAPNAILSPRREPWVGKQTKPRNPRSVHGVVIHALRQTQSHGSISNDAEVKCSTKPFGGWVNEFGAVVTTEVSHPKPEVM